MRKWTDEEFIETVKKSESISDFLRHFGVPRAQGWYHKLFHKYAERLDVDTSHFLKKATPKNKKPLEEILVKNSTYAWSSLRKRVIGAGLLENKCDECGLGPEWNEKKLVLHLDHINGDHTDNRIENLRILCPNCHTQTETYGGSNKEKIEAKVYHRNL